MVTVSDSPLCCSLSRLGFVGLCKVNVLPLTVRYHLSVPFLHRPVVNDGIPVSCALFLLLPVGVELSACIGQLLIERKCNPYDDSQENYEYEKCEFQQESDKRHSPFI